MKIKELINELRKLDQETEIKVLIPLPNRPFGGNLKPIHNVNPVTDQDTNQTIYVIETESLPPF